MKCFILSQLNFINCCLILVFIVNFSAGNSSKSSDDLIFVVPTETVDFVRLTNDSSTSETYSDALSLHFKLPLTLNKLYGKFLKEVELRIPSEFLSDDVSFLNNKKASYRSKCSTSDERSVFLVTLSRKTKCWSLVTHFQDVPVGLSKNCTNDDICIDVSRIMSHLEWCNGSLLEDIYLDLTSCVNNDDILQRIRTKRHLNLTLLYSEPSCNFDDGCEWRNISSEGYSYLTDKKQGTYGKFIPRHHNYMFNLLSPVIYGSGYQCHLTFSILSGFAEVSLTIHSGSVNKTIFVYLATNSSHWERLDLPIGRVSEHFQVEIQVILPKFSSLSIDNVTFEHCSESEEKDDFKQKCKNDEFKCSTGLCVSKDKICDLVPDCLFSDDEENAECESIPVEGRCDFETTTCNWTMETISTDSNCNWNRRSITQLNNNKMPERTISKQAEGYVLYIQTTNCKQVQPLKSRIFPAFEPGNCEIKFSYSFEQVGELFLKMCYNKSITSDCVNLRTFPSIDHWKKISVVIPEPEKEFYLEFDTLPFIGYILLDNIIMTPDCFREKLTDPLVNPVA
ncbi:hypothetical protein KUTeg_006971 [Tegillarca granosa]|uniref:MAM domain-containing protein n=1 Tax=Tegillarca granosa TaxID=220873 RepID=A0ABQ9FDW2_TEGGR|nr:hypothetical protein KUTeg_006971 [Tegillarca granosa]